MSLTVLIFMEYECLTHSCESEIKNVQFEIDYIYYLYLANLQVKANLHLRHCLIAKFIVNLCYSRSDFIDFE